MAVLDIIKGKDHPVLRSKTKRVAKVTKDIVKLIADMEETTRAAKGAGIAAPQIARTERVCIAMLQRKLTPLINPRITWRSDEVILAEEGCLSLPDIWIEVPRAKEILVEFVDVGNRKKQLRLTDLDARVVQHEVDHLEGKLIVDYLKDELLL